MLVNIIVREFLVKRKINGFIRLVRRDYNNVFKKERVNLSGFKFKLADCKFLPFCRDSHTVKILAVN